jgi:hypothetical protein
MAAKLSFAEFDAKLKSGTLTPAEIPKFKPDWFIFSGGGNDLQESLARRELVHTYDAARPNDQCLTPKGISLLVEIAEGVRTLLNEVAIAHPALQSICFAYDYPRPTFKGGKYIGKHLGKMAYPKTTWDAVARFLIDKLTATIELSSRLSRTPGFSTAVG